MKRALCLALTLCMLLICAARSEENDPAIPGTQIQNDGLINTTEQPEEEVRPDETMAGETNASNVQEFPDNSEAVDNDARGGDAAQNETAQRDLDMQDTESDIEGSVSEAKAEDDSSNNSDQASEGEQTTSEPLSEEKMPAIPKDAEAWLKNDRNIISGHLADLLANLSFDEMTTIYIHTDKTLHVEEVEVRKLRKLQLLPDKSIFAEKDARVCISHQDPLNSQEIILITPQEYAETEQEALADLYIWVETGSEEELLPSEVPSEELNTDTVADTEIKLMVSPDDLDSATWLYEAPSFELSGIPVGQENWSYAAIIYDERIIMLSGNTFVPQQEGIYTLRFAMLDEIGDIVDASERITVWMDLTPPAAYAEADPDTGNTLLVYAHDDISGVAELSLDGGNTWIPFEDDEVYQQSYENRTVLAAGTIQVKDAAGNLWISPSDITLEKIQSYYGGGGGVGGSGDGSATQPKTHAKGEGEDEGKYDALQMKLPEEPMTSLIVDGEEMALTLELLEAQSPDAKVGPTQFSASLIRWPNHDNVNSASENKALDTLLLYALPAKDPGKSYTYSWHFNGEVTRMLANSAVRYLALRVGDDILAFPTQGFTGGAKYTELKMLGVSNRKFDYTITMKVNLDSNYISATSDWDYSQDCDASIHVDVENMSYELSSSEHSAMYFYDLYLGSTDMLQKPFGGYLDQNTQLQDNEEDQQ